MNDDDISLRHLRTLSLLLEVCSLTKAAELLGTNQPTVSKTLARLRSHFADPLFVRVGLSMQPTPRALEIAGPLRGVLAVSDHMHTASAAFDPATSEREFKVLVSEVGMINVVPDLTQRLERAGRGLRLRAVPFDSRHVSVKLEGGEADIAVGVFPREVGSLRRQKLYVDPYVSVVRRDHPRLDRLSRPDDLLRERHIMVTASSTGHAAHEQLERVMMSKLNPDLVYVRVPSFVTSAFVASRTDAVCTLPTKLASYLVRDLPLAVLNPPLALPRIEIAQVWHERVNRDPGHRWLRSTIFSMSRTNREGAAG